MNPESLILAILWTVLGIAPLLVGLWLVYFLLSLPLRRQERVALFLDLLESGANAGHTPEQTLTELARTRDAALGTRLHWLASLVASGQRLDQALEGPARALSPRMSALLRIGLKLGDVRKVLPVCRRLNTDATSMVLGGSNYAVLVLLALSPAMPAIFLALRVFVVPKFWVIFQEMGAAPTPLLAMVMNHAGWIAGLMVLVLLSCYAATILYMGGPRLTAWLRRYFGPVVDRVTWGVPWKRRRLKRDFVATLALLLDVGVAETEALRLAGDVADNAIVKDRVGLATQRLQSGQSLVDAIAALDESGEFQWRLRNATVGKLGFMQALQGWLESLDARAFQMEQAAAQGITTALVLLNGLAVGIIVTSAFQPLTALVHAAALW